MTITDSEPPYTVAIAQADFVGKTPRELSFNQGDEIYLYRQLSQHWWEGQLANNPSGPRGLIPHLYIVPKAALMLLANREGNQSSEDIAQGTAKSSNERDNDGSLCNLDPSGDMDDSKSVTEGLSVASLNYVSESSIEPEIPDSPASTNHNFTSSIQRNSPFLTTNETPVSVEVKSATETKNTEVTKSPQRSLSDSCPGPTKPPRTHSTSESRLHGELYILIPTSNIISTLRNVISTYSM